MNEMIHKIAETIVANFHHSKFDLKIWNAKKKKKCFVKFLSPDRGGTRLKFEILVDKLNQHKRFTFLSVCHSICLSVFLSVCLSFYLSVCLSICLSLSVYHLDGPYPISCLSILSICLSVVCLYDYFLS
jgi:hypothetical protein